MVVTIITSEKDHLLRAFPEILKLLSSILKNIWQLEVTYLIRFGT